MGLALCCAQQDYGTREDMRPRGVFNERASIKTRGQHDHNSPRSELDDTTMSAISNPEKLKFERIFDIEFGSPIRFLSFSQRKFIGFQYHYEFDRKRVLVASDTQFRIYGYDIDEIPCELLSSQVHKSEKIAYIGFISDEKPSSILLVTYEVETKKNIARVLKLKKEMDRSHSVVLQDIECKRKVHDLIKEKLDNNELRMPRRRFENYVYTCDHEQHIENIKTESMTPYLRSKSVKLTAQQLKIIEDTEPNLLDPIEEAQTPAFEDEDPTKPPIEMTDKEENIPGIDDVEDIHIPRAQKTINTNSSFSVANQHQTLQVYEIYEQQFKDTGCFEYFDFFNVSDIKKLAIGQSGENFQFDSFVFNFKLANSKKLDKAKNNENVLIHTHITDYYAKQIKQERYKPICLDQKIKALDRYGETLYVILEKTPQLLILGDSGNIVNKHMLSQCFATHGLTLTKLTFIKVPVLRWSSRQVKMLIGQIKRVLISGEVQFNDKLRSFLMVYNIQTSQAEIIKILDLQVEITELQYGPFDNGHVMVGLSNGQILAFDFLTLNRLEKYQLFETGDAVRKITFDPTHYIFAASDSGKVAMLSFGELRTKYLYVEFAKEKYCTLQVKKQRKDMKDPSQNFCCI